MHPPAGQPNRAKPRKSERPLERSPGKQLLRVFTGRNVILVATQRVHKQSKFTKPTDSFTMTFSSPSFISLPVRSAVHLKSAESIIQSHGTSQSAPASSQSSDQVPIQLTHHRRSYPFPSKLSYKLTLLFSFFSTDSLPFLLVHHPIQPHLDRYQLGIKYHIRHGNGANFGGPEEIRELRGPGRKADGYGFEEGL